MNITPRDQRIFDRLKAKMLQILNEPDENKMNSLYTDFEFDDRDNTMHRRELPQFMQDQLYEIELAIYRRQHEVEEKRNPIVHVPIELPPPPTESEIRQRHQETQRRIEEENQRWAELPGTDDFWSEVKRPTIITTGQIFDTGKSFDNSMFQFFLLDDVRDVWKTGNDNLEFACSNPIDMITQEPISSPVADGRILIYFSNRNIECWDAYGISAFVASQIANNKIPTHPTDRKPYTQSTIALLGFVHGILREAGDVRGVKKQYMQEVFEKYKKELATQLEAEKIALTVGETFDNPTIAFKQMVCERKLWFEDDKTPEGLCSAKPLKDLINFAQYQRELKLNVLTAKTKGLNVARREAQRRTVSGAELPDTNETNSTYRKVNQ
jgi:hypothetical protein